MSPELSLQGMLSGDSYRLLIQNYYYIGTNENPDQFLF